MRHFLFLARRDDAAWQVPCEEEQRCQGQKGACSVHLNLKRFGYIFIFSSLVACNAQDKVKPPLSPEPVPQRAKPSENDINAVYVYTDSKMKKKVAAAKQDLASRLNRLQKSIEVVEARYVTWRDTSLGCPGPGQAYAQVLTNGARIKLRVDNRTYHYHSAKGRPPFLCEQPSPNDPLPYDLGDS